MSDYELRINIYNTSRFGHANVSFYEDGEHVYTIGANVLLESYKLALPQMIPFQPDDGVYRDETAYHEQALLEGSVISRPLAVGEDTWRDLLDRATALENETFNYSLFSEACTDLVGEFYAASGHPGAFGDLFAPDEFDGSLVWMRVPVTMAAPDPATPPYAPTEPPDDGAATDDVGVAGPSHASTIAPEVIDHPAPLIHDPSVDLAFADIEPVVDGAVAVEVLPPVPTIDPAEPLTFGDIAVRSSSDLPDADTFVFGTPAGEAFSGGADQVLRGGDSESARVEPYVWSSLQDESEDDGESYDAGYATQSPTVETPETRAADLSFGIHGNTRNADFFDTAPREELSFGSPDDEPITVADLPLSFGSTGEPAPDDLEDEPQKAAFWDDFWPF